MLLRFRVENYASFRDEQEMSLIALDEHPDLAVVPVPMSSDRALPVAGLFGANASGKSNVLRAAIFVRDAITQSHQSWLPEDPIPRWPFRLDDEHPGRPSRFQVDFVLDGVRFEYGFSLDDSKIHEEWLYTWPKGKRQRLFERSAGKIDFGPGLLGAKAAIAELVRENSLFLSAAAANNHAQLRPVAAWFRTWRFMSSAAGSRTSALQTTPSDDVIELLKFADVGIVGAAVVARNEEEWANRLGRLRRRPGSSRADDPGRSIELVELLHRASTNAGQESLPWHWESSGTQSWLHAAGAAVAALKSGSVMFVDDLGSDLHPSLTAQLVGLFQNPETNQLGAQFVFTGHDVSLLGRHVEFRLYRDQVWLASKSDAGASAVYPLTEYGRIRDGIDDVEGRYLQGRYGAVPFFDNRFLDVLKSSAVREPATGQ